MNTTTASDDVAGVDSHTSAWRASLEIGAVGLGALMAALSQTLVVPVLPVIAEDLGASTTQMQWLLTSTLLVSVVAVPIFGRFADMFGRRLLLVICLSGLALGSLIDAVTTDIALAIVGRALCGLAMASIPLGISLLSSVLPAARAGSAVALVSAMLGIGSALGLPLAGVLADNTDYHVLYWIGAAGAGLSVAGILGFVHEPKPKGERSLDLPGIILLAGGLVCLVLGLSQGGDWGWSSVRIVGLLVVAVVMLGLFVFVERRTAAPLMDLRALVNPPIAMTNVASLFFGFALFASFVGTANYVQAPEATGYGFGASVLVAGLCLLPSGLSMLVLAPVAARLNAAWGAGRVLALSSGIVAIGLVERLVLTDSLWQVVLGTAVIGAGTGIGYASLPTLISLFTSSEDLAAANGINNLARSLGSTLASAIGGSILSAVTMNLGGYEIASLEAYRILFVVCAVAAILAAGFGVVIARSAAAGSTKTVATVRGHDD